MDRADLQDIVVNALTALGGTGSIVDICRYIWEHHENDLRNSGDLFYTWQYEMRWAGQKLQDDGVMKKMGKSGGWTLLT